MLPGHQNRRTAVIALALLLLLGVCAFVIVRQGRRILSLEAALRESRSPIGVLSEGATFGPLNVRDTGGNIHVIDFKKTKSRGTILYVLRPGCVWCQRNNSDIALLASHVAREYDVIGLSLVSNGLEDFIRREDVRFPVYTDIPAVDQTLYRLGNTPETIVVSSSGRVVKSWIGAYSRDPIKSDIEQFFSLQFPGKGPTLLD